MKKLIFILMMVLLSVSVLANSTLETNETIKDDGKTKINDKVILEPVTFDEYITTKYKTDTKETLILIEKEVKTEDIKIVFDTPITTDDLKDIYIKEKSVYIDSDKNIKLDSKATIYFYNINYMLPIIKKNNERINLPFTYDKEIKTLWFDVTGFSEYSVEDGCVAYYNFSSLEDLCGTYDATNSGATSVSVYPTYNTSGNSSPTGFDFDGTNDVVTIADNDAFSFVNGTSNDLPFSISYWVKHDTLTGTQTHVNKWSATGYEYYSLTFSNGTIGYILQSQGNSGVQIGRLTPNVLTTGSWQYFTFTYSGNSSSSGMKIYLNGERVDNADNNVGTYVRMSNTAQPVTIGSRGTIWLNGQMDDVKFFNVELNETEISNLYNYGNIEGEEITFVSPTTTTGQPSNIDYTSVTLNGQVTSDGECNDTDHYFQYGTFNNYVAINTTLSSIYTINETISTSISGLETGTKYQYRSAVFCNDNNVSYYGSYITFRTISNAFIIGTKTGLTAVSNDGETFTLGDSIGEFTKIEYNPNTFKFMALYDGGFYTSNDGLNWTFEFGETITHYAYSPTLDRYLFAFSDTSNYLYTDNLVNFVSSNANYNVNMVFNKQWGKFSYYVASGSSKFDIYTSSDGITFNMSIQDLGEASTLCHTYNPIAYYDKVSGYYFFSGGCSGQTIPLAYSTNINLHVTRDGETWERLYIGSDETNLVSMVYNSEEDIFIGSGILSNVNRVYTFNTNFTNITINSVANTPSSRVIYNKNLDTYFKYEYHTSSTTGYYSKNKGIAFTSITLPENIRVYSSEELGLFLAVQNNGSYYYSDDGITFTETSNDLTDYFTIYVIEDVLLDGVTTSTATLVTNTTARLIMNVNVNTCSNIPVSFEYKEVGGASEYTIPFDVTGSVTFFEDITELTPNTNYEYRAQAVLYAIDCPSIDNDTTIYGDWVNFTTLTSEVVPVGDLTRLAFIPNVNSPTNKTFRFNYSDYFSGFTDVRASFDYNGVSYFVYNDECVESGDFLICVAYDSTYYVEISTITESITDINLRVFKGIESKSDTFTLTIDNTFSDVEYYFAPTFNMYHILSGFDIKYVFDIDDMGNCTEIDYYLVHYTGTGSQSPVLIQSNITSVTNINHTIEDLTPLTTYYYKYVAQCMDDLSVYQNTIESYQTGQEGQIIIEPIINQTDFDGIWDAFTGGNNLTKLFIGFVMILGIVFIGFQQAGQSNIQLGMFGMFMLFMIATILMTAIGLIPVFVLILIIVVGIVGILLKTLFGGYE